MLFGSKEAEGLRVRRRKRVKGVPGMTAADATDNGVPSGFRRKQGQDGGQRRIEPWVMKIIVLSA